MKKTPRPCTPQPEIVERESHGIEHSAGGASSNREALKFRIGNKRRTTATAIAVFRCGTFAVSAGGPWSWRGDGRGWPF